ncbi:ATP-binding cassette domain-containing protein [Microlunatus sp. GCM10028923]|uniref:ATP-binding cassette domain-containing protein n=1 Tax=Microlunatus sp. GCM10028923 TaxID=3273400 RepID=UPI0036192523
MINVTKLGKRYGERWAVQDLGFTAPDGQVTGFLGPNGAGKSTTLRMVLGLTRPTTGQATIDGARFADLATPARTVGALLDATTLPEHLTGEQQLRWFAAAASLDPARIPVVLDLVGLADHGRRRIGAYSLGMRQRLGLACALLGDPANLVLDEPVNGLDPAGVRWLRELLAGLADEGRTVIVSSHLLTEVQLLADRVVVIGQGRLLADQPLAELVGGSATVRVGSADNDRLAEALRPYATIGPDRPDTFAVTGLDPAEIGRIALTEGIPLVELSRTGGLEDAFLALTHEHTLTEAGR